MTTIQEQLEILSTATGRYYYAVHHCGGDGITIDACEFHSYKSFEEFLEEKFDNFFNVKRIIESLKSINFETTFDPVAETPTSPTFGHKWILGMYWEGLKKDVKSCYDDMMKEVTEFNDKFNSDIGISTPGGYYTLKSNEDVKKFNNLQRSRFEAEMKEVLKACEERTKELNSK